MTVVPRTRMGVCGGAGVSWERPSPACTGLRINIPACNCPMTSNIDWSMAMAAAGGAGSLPATSAGMPRPTMPTTSAWRFTSTPALPELSASLSTRPKKSSYATTEEISMSLTSNSSSGAPKRPMARSGSPTSGATSAPSRTAGRSRLPSIWMTARSRVSSRPTTSPSSSRPSEWTTVTEAEEGTRWLAVSTYPRLLKIRPRALTGPA